MADGSVVMSLMVPHQAAERRRSSSETPPRSVRTSEYTDETLLADIGSGNLRALEALYDRYHGMVLGMALRRGCPEAEAEDIAHEVFVALWRRPPTLVDARLSTWLYRVTANKVASLHRRRNIRRTLADQLAGLLSAAPDDRLERDVAAKDAVREILSRMSPKKREVLVLFELE
ncbi:MAG: sigma-70 family RNA polymerase sigma factor, partial [Myxococcota bacterium]